MARKRYAVIDATAGTTKGMFGGLAYRYVLWEMERHGIEAVEPHIADVVLVTAVSAAEWKTVAKALKKNGVAVKSRRGKQRVCLGGQAAMCPKVFDDIVDLCCVGEGQKFLHKMFADGYDSCCQLKNAWVPGEARKVVPDAEFPWDVPPTKAEDGIVRIYASRGCKKKCLFCQIGWQGLYKETDAEKPLTQYYALKKLGHRVNVVTNDAPALSFFDAFDKLEHYSASYSQILELVKYDDVADLLGCVRSVRLGIEAPSSRLRRWIGKPIDIDDCYKLSVMLLNKGIGVRWFMIAGLPGECDDDYDEFKKIVIDIRHDVKKGALQLSFTAFCPDPAAPLCLAPLDDSYWDRFTAFKEWFFGIGYTHRCQIYKCAMPKNRLKHAIGSMGSNESQLRKGFLNCDPPNWRVQYPFQQITRRAYNVYATRVGIKKSQI